MVNEETHSYTEMKPVVPVPEEEVSVYTEEPDVSENLPESLSTTAEEMKFQPSTSTSSPTCPDERRRIARERNNEASRRSRLKKKRKLQDMDEELKELSVEVPKKRRRKQVKSQIVEELKRVLLISASK